MNDDQDESIRRRYCLFGAAGDTGNLGVSALGESTLHAIARHDPDARVLVFDNGRGRRQIDSNEVPPHERDGGWISRRVYRSESLWTMLASSSVRVPPNRNVSAIRSARMVLDISGGDSFTDMYGPKRWQMVALSKSIALRTGTPLVLLPQTYGPFHDTTRRQQAADIIARAESAWTRDADGLDVLHDLLGDRFDPRRHRPGVDVAFALPTSRPAIDDDQATRILGTPGRVRVGLNVSGLLTAHPERARQQFGLSIRYPDVIRALCRRLLDEVADHVVLVPHVRGAGEESDDRACEALRESMSRPDRLTMLPPGLNAAETKWFISQLDWFCGTRMHATIAALSTGVPASALAYSLKTKGVFATCGMDDAVVDARVESSSDAVEQLISLAHRRTESRDQLRAHVGQVVNAAIGQFSEILIPSGGSSGEIG